MKNLNCGFTAIEMMIVIAVIAILASVAIPSYHTKLVREQITEAMKLADIAKPPIATSWSTAKILPADNKEAGLPAADKIVSNFISDVSVKEGVINMTFGNNAMGTLKGKLLSIRPAVVEDAPVVPVAWICAKAAVPDKMIVKGEDRTDIPKDYLPRSCRDK